MLNVYSEIMDELDKDENIEAISFGDWERWDSDGPHDKVPKNTVMDINTAWKYLEGWSAYNDYGTPLAYAIFVWTNKNVLFISQYDGSTTLNKIPRNPSNEIFPYMPGG